MSQFTDLLCGIATEWRTRNQEHQSGVVLLWQGAVYGWKDCLRDATHERPGVYAVDEDGHVFLAEGGNDYDGAKCWVVVSPDSPAPLVLYVYQLRWLWPCWTVASDGADSGDHYSLFCVRN
uniref:Antirestriction protein ArdR n=1 Tax=Pseudomonas migulae TaxID=78543 RepID=R4IUZ2_9PSED|nr:hypothetical protein pD2RT_001 [Pseudomonas migulae]